MNSSWLSSPGQFQAPLGVLLFSSSLEQHEREPRVTEIKEGCDHWQRNMRRNGCIKCCILIRFASPSDLNRKRRITKQATLVMLAPTQHARVLGGVLQMVAIYKTFAPAAPPGAWGWLLTFALRPQAAISIRLLLGKVSWNNCEKWKGKENLLISQPWHANGC